MPAVATPISTRIRASSRRPDPCSIWVDGASASIEPGPELAQQGLPRLGVRHQVIDEKEATILCLIALPVTADNSDTKGMHIRR